MKQHQMKHRIKCSKSSVKTLRISIHNRVFTLIANSYSGTNCIWIIVTTRDTYRAAKHKWCFMRRKLQYAKVRAMREDSISLAWPCNSQRPNQHCHYSLHQRWSLKPERGSRRGDRESSAYLQNVPNQQQVRFSTTLSLGMRLNINDEITQTLCMKLTLSISLYCKHKHIDLNVSNQTRNLNKNDGVL